MLATAAGDAVMDLKPGALLFAMLVGLIGWIALLSLSCEVMR